MGVFIIIPTKAEHSLDKVIQEQFPEDSYRLPLGQFAIAFNGPAKALSDQLGISDGSSGLGVVASIASYYGRAPTDFWEWLKIKMERD